jgi:hypothetical protein
MTWGKIYGPEFQGGRAEALTDMGDVGGVSAKARWG